MEFRKGTRVFTAGGEQVGEVNRFVLDPVSDEVTHIVVQKGWLLPEDKVIAIESIQTATDERVILREQVTDFDDLPPFEELHYVERGDGDPPHADRPADTLAPVYYWYPPSGFGGYPAYHLDYGRQYYAWPAAETKRNIPEEAVALKEGADVISSDEEHVGDIERLYVDSDSNKATHFVISRGLLLKERKLVPADWVQSVAENRVRLAVPSRLLERLPPHES